MSVVVFLLVVSLLGFFCCNCLFANEAFCEECSVVVPAVDTFLKRVLTLFVNRGCVLCRRIRRKLVLLMCICLRGVLRICNISSI